MEDTGTSAAAILGTWVLRLLYGVGGLAGVAVGLLYAFQNKLAYIPNIPGIPREELNRTPDEYGLDYEDVWLVTSDNVKIHGWFMKLPTWDEQFLATRPVLLFFQENAGVMAFRLPYLRMVMRQLQCPVFAPSYRGYGKSHGSPNQAGMMKDAEASLNYLLTRKDVDTRRVIVLGRSIGGAVAIHLVAQFQDKIAALMIENTFTSLEDMVQAVLPVLGTVIGTGKPMNFLVRDKWRNAALLPTITRTKLLLMCSGADEMVAPYQMRELRSLAKAPVVEWVEFEGAHHMDAYSSHAAQYWPAMRQFVQRHVSE